ncbi:MAG: type II secretion system GspH family protein, partial [Acidobacteriota bacterium]|nr:type II secretion system GspH family protein [Acidobacteriota bacterium]
VFGLYNFKETLINCLRGRIAKLFTLCGARNLNIFLYMPRPLGSVRLALHPAQTINQRFPNEKGFTLLELIVVTLIIALVLGISYPSIERGSNILNLQTASRDVLNTFRFAREKAVSEQATMLLIIDREERRLELANVLGEPIRAYTLPKGIYFQRMIRAGNEVGDNAMAVRFAPNGSLESVDIYIASDGGSRLRIVSDPLGGGARREPVWEDYR